MFTIRARVLRGIVIGSAAFVGTVAPAVPAAASGQAAPQVIVEHCGGGVDALTIVPDPTFDPLRATPAELHENHLPQKPSNPEDLADWVRLVTGPLDRQTTCADTRPQTSVQPGGPSLPVGAAAGSAIPSAVSAGSASAQTSLNWAGNIATGHAYVDAEARWAVPSATSKANAYSSQWVGIGSDSSSTAQLYQAGTEVDGNGNKQGFYEPYPAINQVLTKGVSAGDIMDVEVILGGKGQYGTFDVLDATTSWSQTYRVSQVNNPASAEFIDERTTVNGKLPLYTHQSVRFLNTRLGWSTGGGTIGEVSHVYENMYDACNTELANTQSIDSSGSYTVNWDAYGVAGSSC